MGALLAQCRFQGWTGSRLNFLLFSDKQHGGTYRARSEEMEMMTAVTEIRENSVQFEFMAVR